MELPLDQFGDPGKGPRVCRQAMLPRALQKHLNQVPQLRLGQLLWLPGVRLGLQTILPDCGLRNVIESAVGPRITG